MQRIDWQCNEGFIWNSSNCEYECDTSCEVGEYLNYKNCKCRKRLVDQLVGEFTENIDEAKIVEITLFEHKNVHKPSCTLHIVLLSVVFTTNIGIGTYFVYYKCMNRNKENVSRYVYVYQTAKY